MDGNPHRGAWRRLFVLEGFFVRNGEFLAALFPAGSQHPAAISCGHPLTKTVLVTSFPARGLICTFHGR
jgi:hypothetical protein